MNFALQPLRAGLVGFVDHEDVGDLHDAGLDGLHIVAHARHQHHHGHLRHARDLDFVLAHAHGFDEDEVFAGGIQQRGQVRGGARQSADRAARGHGADEDARIGVVPQHADAVAQNGAAGTPAGGVDGDDAHGAALPAQLARQGIHQRALARARRAGDPDHHAHGRRAAAARAEPASARGSRFSIPVAARASARASPSAILRAQCVHQLFRSCRAITRRWISLVPSPMVHSFTSR